MYPDKEESEDCLAGVFFNGTGCRIFRHEPVFGAGYMVWL